MAAPCRLCGVLRLGFQLSPIERHVRIAGHQVQQYRFKKGAGRRSAPPVHADTGKWTFTKKKPKIIVETTETRILKASAEDDVWIGKYYEPLKHDLLTAIQMHREFCQPAMLNAPKAKLDLSVKLDLRTKKKTKFINVIKKTVVLPYDFDDGPKNRVMVFVKDEELQKVATEVGAAFVGGLDLVKSIEKGEIRHDDFDHVVCHVDMLADLSSVRKFLRDHFPNKSKGNLGGDIRQMVTFFTFGKTYESQKLEEAVGKLNVTLGTLDMPDEQLTANHDTFIESICSHRSPQLGPFITEGLLSCKPSPEMFLIDPNLLRPVSERKAEIKELEQEEEVAEKGEDSDDDEPAVMKK